MEKYAVLILAVFAVGSMAQQARQANDKAVTIESFIEGLFTAMGNSVTKLLEKVTTQSKVQALILGAVGWIASGSLFFPAYGLLLFIKSTSSTSGIAPGIASLVIWRAQRQLATVILFMGAMLVWYGH
jgi:hypothetical protein